MAKDQNKQGAKRAIRDSAEQSAASPRRTQYDILIEFCLIFLIIFTPFVYGAVEPWSIAVFEIAAGVMFLAWFLKMLKNNTIEFIKTPVTIFIFLFIFYVCLQLFFSSFFLRPSSIVLRPSSLISLLATCYFHATKAELLKIIAYSMIFFVTLNTIKTKQQITRILSVTIATGFIMSIVYLIRYLGVNAPFGLINPDHFSAYLGMIIPLALGLLFVFHHPLSLVFRPSFSLRFLLFFCVIVMSSTLFFTMSRGGMFSFIAALLVMAVLASQRKSFKNKRWILIAVAIFIILTIAWLGATPVVEKILSIKAEVSSLYFGGRFPIWQGTLSIIKDHPIFGTGLGTFNYIFPKYQPLEIISRHYTHAHSDILQLLSETGIIGFSLLATLCLLLATYVFRHFRRRKDPWVIGMSIGFFGSLASIFVHSFTDFNLHIPANAILLTIILALFILILNYKRDGIFSLRYTQPVLRSLGEGGYAIRNTKFILYPTTVLLSGIFIVMSVTPAIADYYFRQAVSEHGPSTMDYGLLQKAIKLDPTNALYHYHLGKLYNQPSAISHQLSAYKKSIKLNPTNSKYHQSLAWSYGVLADTNTRNTQYAIRNTNFAHQEFQQAIDLEPNNAYRYRSYARWLFSHPEGENIEIGVEEYRKAVLLDLKLAGEAFDAYYSLTGNQDVLSDIAPETGMGYLLLSEYLSEKGFSDKSMELKQKSISKLLLEIKTASPEKKAEIHACLGNSYCSMGKYIMAIEEYKKMIKIETNNFWAHYSLAMAYTKAKDYNLAEKTFKAAQNIDSDNCWTYFNLARLYESQNRMLEAKAMWRKILDLKNSSEDARRIAERELGKDE